MTTNVQVNLLNPTSLMSLDLVVTNLPANLTKEQMGYMNHGALMDYQSHLGNVSASSRNKRIQHEIAGVLLDLEEVCAERFDDTVVATNYINPTNMAVIINNTNELPSKVFNADVNAALCEMGLMINRPIVSYGKSYNSFFLTEEGVKTKLGKESEGGKLTKCVWREETCYNVLEHFKSKL